MRQDRRCKYCGHELPLSYDEIRTEGKTVDCTGCQVRYTPVLTAGVMGNAVEIYDDGPPQGIAER